MDIITTESCTSNIVENQIINNNCTINTQNNIEKLSSSTNNLKQFTYNLSNCEKHFTDRENELKEIENFFDDSNIKINKILVICGPSAAGKTKLARQFAWNYKNKHNANIIWIDADSNPIEDLCTTVAIELHICTEINNVNRNHSQIIQDIYEILNQRETLVIFDNLLALKKIDTFLKQNNYNNQTNSGYNYKNIKVLITSRKNEWGDIKSIKLNSYKIDDSSECSESDGERDKKLADELAYAPSSLQKLIGYIKNNIIDSFTSVPVSSKLCE